MERPSGLGSTGIRLWDDLVSVWELRPDEYRLLEHAARTVDELGRLQDLLARTDLFVEGSNGQPRSTPLLADLRGHRDLLLKLLRQLDLPDGVVAPQRSALSEKRAAAANTRWARVRAQREGTTG